MLNATGLTHDYLSPLAMKETFGQYRHAVGCVAAFRTLPCLPSERERERAGGDWRVTREVKELWRWVGREGRLKSGRPQWREGGCQGHGRVDSLPAECNPIWEGG